MKEAWKRTGALLLALALAASLAACERKEDRSETEIGTLTPPPSSAAQEDSAEESRKAFSDGLTEEGYFEGIAALDYVTLPEIKSISIPEETATVSDEDLQNELDDRLSAFLTTEHVTDRAVEDGDSVNIDYVGSVDGVEFAGGSTNGSGTTVTAGSTQYIDDFLTQIIGHMPGETFDVNVTFPENYGNEELNGKDALFVTTINYIEETVAPQLTDEFVYSNWYESNGWSTAAEANEAIRGELLETNVGNYLWAEIQEQAEVKEVPESLYNYQVAAMKSYYASIAEQYGMPLDEFLYESLQVLSIDDAVAKNESVLQTNAKASLIMQALCEQNHVTVSDEDIAGYFRNVMNVSDYTEFEKEYGRPYLALLAREDKAKRALAGMA